MTVRYVATPHDLDELCELMATAHQRGLAVLARGSGSKLGWLDLPPVVDLMLDLSAFNALHYDPRLGQVTAGSALPVAMVQDELATLGVRLGLDPPSTSATLGGVLVSGESGPLSHRFGPPAAHVVDATVVLPDGTLTHVADRVRLLGTGVCDLRWANPGRVGAACAVVDVTLITEPLPEAQAWVGIPVEQPLHAGERLVEILRVEPAPSAVELDVPGIRLGAVAAGQRRATGSLAVLVEGSRASVADRVRELVGALGERSHVTDQPPQWWGRYPFRPGEVALRLSIPDGQLHLICYALADAVGAPVPVRGSLGGGPAWAALPGDLPHARLITILDAVRGVLLARGGSAVVQASPSALKEVLIPYRQP